MSKLTMHDAIRKALIARGERRVHDASLSKYEKWTRTYKIPRAPDGTLQRIDPSNGGTVYFVARYSPTIRIGEKSTTSRSMASALVKLLVEEGRALP